MNQPWLRPQHVAHLFEPSPQEIIEQVGVALRYCCAVSLLERLAALGQCASRGARRMRQNRIDRMSRSHGRGCTHQGQTDPEPKIANSCSESRKPFVIRRWGVT